MWNQLYVGAETLHTSSYFIRYTLFQLLLCLFSLQQMKKKTAWSSRNRKKEEMGKLVNETSELCCSIKRQVLGKTLHQTIISYERVWKESKRRPSITSNFSPFTFWTNFSQKNMLSSGTREKCQIVRRRRQKIEWDLGCWHDIIRWIEEHSPLFEFINMNRIAGSSSAVL